MVYSYSETSLCMDTKREYVGFYVKKGASIALGRAD